MKRIFPTLALLLLLCISQPINAQVGELQRVAPETVGVPSAAVQQFLDSLLALPDTEIHSVMVLRDGKVIGEVYPAPFAPEYRHTMYSCSKTFVALAAGLAYDDNRLRVDDRVALYFPELLPDTISSGLADMTVRDLLTMTSGITPDWSLRSKVSDWTRAYLAKPIEVQPGTKYQYDSMVTYLLSAVVQRATGKTVLELLRERVFEPMGITEVAWEESPEGVNTGGWGLHIQSESLAKLGQMLMDGGMWDGKQLVSQDWIEQMTSPQTKTGRDGAGFVDYGYQTWICRTPGSFRADGALAQYVIGVPDKDVVVVMTESTLGNGAKQRDLVWDVLLPAVVDETMTPGKAYKNLQKMEKNASLPLPKGKRGGKAQAALTDGATYALDANPFGWETISIDTEGEKVVVKVTDKRGDVTVMDCGYRRWLTKANSAYPPYSIGPVEAFRGIEGPFYVSGAYAWKSAKELQIKVHFVNWVTSLLMNIDYGDASKPSITVDTNYSKKPVTLEVK